MIIRGIMKKKLLYVGMIMPMVLVAGPQDLQTLLNKLDLKAKIVNSAVKNLNNFIKKEIDKNEELYGKIIEERPTKEDLRDLSLLAAEGDSDKAEKLLQQSDSKYGGNRRRMKSDLNRSVIENNIKEAQDRKRILTELDKWAGQVEQTCIKKDVKPKKTRSKGKERLKIN